MRSHTEGQANGHLTCSHSDNMNIDDERPAKSSHGKRDKLDVTGRYCLDCSDLLRRYDVMEESWLVASKPRRLKCFIDLRMAYECVLKSAVAYTQPDGSSRQAVIASATSHSHKIADLLGAIAPDYAEQLGLADKWNVLDDLPVGLRYALDAYDFIDEREGIYYQTIGNDWWMDDLRTYVGSIRDAVCRTLEQYSGVVAGNDVEFGELRRPIHNVYRDKGTQKRKRG